jgi:hypothetical protein
LERNPNLVFVQHDVADPFDVEGPVDFIFHFASPASPPPLASRPKHLPHPLAPRQPGPGRLRGRRPPPKTRSRTVRPAPGYSMMRSGPSSLSCSNPSRLSTRAPTP